MYSTGKATGSVSAIIIENNEKSTNKQKVAENWVLMGVVDGVAVPS